MNAILVLAVLSADPGQLVNGAPLYDPNVAVHVVEKKPFSDATRFEAALYPVAPQVNGKFTDHVGTAAGFTYHLKENFALQALGLYNWYSSESAFNQELINSAHVMAQAASALLLTWGTTAGVEVSPFYGKFSFYEGRLAQFSMVLNAGAGVGGTRVQLRPENDAGPAVFGDAGVRGVGTLGGGFRVLLGDRFALRLEVRDVVYAARVDTIDGCNASDLTAITASLPAGVTPTRVSSGCNTAAFTGVTVKGSGFAATGGYTYSHAGDVPLAFSLVSTPSSDVLNNLSLNLGVSLLF